MQSMTLHILNAQEKLTNHYDWLETCLTETYTKASALMLLPSVDIIVKTSSHVIPEKGHLGYAPEPGVIFISVDPDNPVFCANPCSSLERMFAHELHHAARWAGPGYGFTLGEALVSEGLAGHFSIDVCTGQPELWECLNTNEIEPHIKRAIREWERADYDHNLWFFGNGDLPRWLGYSLGFQLVSRYLSGHPEQRAATLSDTDAQVFRPFLIDPEIKV